MTHNCGHSHSVPSSVYQTLEELDFERGIWYAAQHNDITRIEKLLGQGVSPNAEDAAGYTALHYASRAGHLELCRILLSAGAEPNSLTRAGRASSLHRAASRGLVDIVKLLLKSGALPDLQDSDGKTALHRAAEGGHYLVAQALLDAEVLMFRPTYQAVQPGRGPRYVDRNIGTSAFAATSPGQPRS